MLETAVLNILILLLPQPLVPAKKSLVYFLFFSLLWWHRTEWGCMSSVTRLAAFQEALKHNWVCCFFFFHHLREKFFQEVNSLIQKTYHPLAKTKTLVKSLMNRAELLLHVTIAAQSGITRSISGTPAETPGTELTTGIVLSFSSFFFPKEITYSFCLIFPLPLKLKLDLFFYFFKLKTATEADSLFSDCYNDGDLRSTSISWIIGGKKCLT